MPARQSVALEGVPPALSAPPPLPSLPPSSSRADSSSRTGTMLGFCGQEQHTCPSNTSNAAASTYEHLAPCCRRVPIRNTGAGAHAGCGGARPRGLLHVLQLLEVVVADGGKGQPVALEVHGGDGGPAEKGEGRPRQGSAQTKAASLPRNSNPRAC